MSGDHFNKSADDSYNHPAAGSGGFQTSGSHLGLGERAEQVLLEAENKVKNAFSGNSSANPSGNTAANTREGDNSIGAGVNTVGDTRNLGTDSRSTGLGSNSARLDSTATRDYDSSTGGTRSQGAVGYANTAGNSDVPYDSGNLVDRDGLDSGSNINRSDRYYQQGANSGISSSDRGRDSERSNYGRDAAIGLGGVGAGAAATSELDRHRDQQSNLRESGNNQGQDYSDTKASNVRSVSDINSVDDARAGMENLKMKHTDDRGFTDVTGGSGVPNQLAGTGLTGKFKNQDGEAPVVETEFNRSEMDAQGRELDSYGKPYTL